MVSFGEYSMGTEGNTAPFKALETAQPFPLVPHSPHLRTVHAREVAGSIPAAPTPKGPGNRAFPVWRCVCAQRWLLGLGNVWKPDPGPGRSPGLAEGHARAVRGTRRGRPPVRAGLLSLALASGLVRKRGSQVRKRWLSRANDVRTKASESERKRRARTRGGGARVLRELHELRKAVRGHRRQRHDLP